MLVVGGAVASVLVGGEEEVLQEGVGLAVAHLLVEEEVELSEAG